MFQNLPVTTMEFLEIGNKYNTIKKKKFIYLFISLINDGNKKCE